MAESASAIGPIPSATAELPPTRLRPSGTIVHHALVERSTGAAAWATRLRSATSVQALHLGHRRFGPSRRRVEARALRTALEEALAAGWRTVTVLVSDRRGARWLEGALLGGRGHGRPRPGPPRHPPRALRLR